MPRSVPDVVEAPALLPDGSAWISPGPALNWERDSSERKSGLHVFYDSMKEEGGPLERAGEGKGVPQICGGGISK